VRNLWTFVKWLLRKWFASNNRWYLKYEQAVVRDPLTLFAGTILIYGLLWILSFVPLIALNAEDTTGYLTWAVIAVIVFGNYFRILLTEQYRIFKRERQQLFEKIKHS
jgi:hypothetical protein